MHAIAIPNRRLDKAVTQSAEHVVVTHRRMLQALLSALGHKEDDSASLREMGEATGTRKALYRATAAPTPSAVARLKRFHVAVRAATLGYRRHHDPAGERS